MLHIIFFCISFVYVFAEDCASCNRKGYLCYNPGWAVPCFVPKGGFPNPEATCLSYAGAKYCPEGSTTTSTPADDLPLDAATAIKNYRLIAYVPNWEQCPPDHQVARYTHILVAFSTTYTDGGIPGQCVWSDKDVCGGATDQIARYQKAGKKVMLSIGGWLQNPHWRQCIDKVDQMVEQLVSIVNSRGFDGIDIDFENASKYGDFLSQLTKGLRKSLPAGALLSHVPMDHDIDSKDKPYYKQLKKSAEYLDFIGVQYYNGFMKPAVEGYVGSGAKQHYDRIVNDIFAGDAQKVVFGFCHGDCGAFDATGEQAVNVMTDLTLDWPQNGGAFFWSAQFDESSAFSAPVFDYLKTLSKSSVEATEFRSIMHPSGCPGGHYVSTDTSRVPDAWCMDNCARNPSWCLSTGFCKCSTDVPNPTNAPTEPHSTPSAKPTSEKPTPADATTTPESTASTTSHAPSGNDPVNLCYFTNWARYRHGYMNNGNDVFENGMDPTLCTHINYGFGTIDKRTFALKPFDPNADLPSGSESQQKPCPDKCKPGYIHDWSKGPNPCEWPCNPDRKLRGYEGLNVGMKRKNPNLKSILSVGGWNFNDCSFHEIAGQGHDSCMIFSTIAGSEENTRTHAKHVVQFLRTWRFDGYDIDWEYPVVAGHNSIDGNATPQDYDNYVRFLRILRQEFEAEAKATGNPRLLLTAAIGVGLQNVKVAYNIPAMSESLDLINMMTYDLHGAWDDVTGFNTALYATDADTEKFKYPLSVSWAVDYWLDHGARPEQLLLGFASYGRGFKLASMDCTGPLCPVTGPCAAGSATKEKGYLAYYEIMDMIKKGAVRHWDDDRKAPYIVTKNGEWVGYDDLESYKYKLDFLKSKGLRGTIVWAIDLDDMRTYPLLNALKSALREDLEEVVSDIEANSDVENFTAMQLDGQGLSTVVLLVVGSLIALTVFAFFAVVYCRTRKNTQDVHQFSLNSAILNLWTPEDKDEPIITI